MIDRLRQTNQLVYSFSYNQCQSMINYCTFIYRCTNKSNGFKSAEKWLVELIRYRFLPFYKAVLCLELLLSLKIPIRRYKLSQIQTWLVKVSNSSSHKWQTTFVKNYFSHICWRDNSKLVWFICREAVVSFMETEPIDRQTKIIWNDQLEKEFGLHSRSIRFPASSWCQTSIIISQFNQVYSSMDLVRSFGNFGRWGWNSQFDSFYFLRKTCNEYRFFYSI